MLEVKNLSYGYQGAPLIYRDLTFEVYQNERVGLIAPSGFGKTTLAKLLTGVYQPNSGHILVNQQDISTFKVSPIQLIYQHPEQAVNPRWRLKKIFSEINQTASKNLLAELGVEMEWLNRYPHELSGGQLQRLLIIRTLLTPAEFIIADEITTMLDPVTQAQVWRVLLQLVARENKGLLIISHNRELLNRVCTRTISLDQLV